MKFKVGDIVAYNYLGTVWHNCLFKIIKIKYAAGPFTVEYITVPEEGVAKPGDIYDILSINYLRKVNDCPEYLK